MRTYTQVGSWYGDNTLAGDYVANVLDSHVTVNGNIVNLPEGGFNTLFLVCKRWGSQILLACQADDRNWLYKDGKWKDLGRSFATFPCAFGPGELFFVCGPNQYRVYDLASDTISPALDESPIAKALGSQGIRYIDYNQSPDGIVTGDSSYGPRPYNLSQWTARDNVVFGQSQDDNLDNGIGYVLGGDKYLVEQGHTTFIRYTRQGNNLAITFVKLQEKQTVFYWFSLDELINGWTGPDGKHKSFPIFKDKIDTVPPEKPKPIPPKEPVMQAPNKLEVVKAVIRAHPEIDVTNEDKRAALLDYICDELNPLGSHKPWGRKSRNKQGTDLNTDGLTYLRTDDKFEIYDVFAGSDPNEDNPDIGKYGTWVAYGPFAQGENGYWWPANPIHNPFPKDPKVPDKPTEPKVALPKHNYGQMEVFADLVRDAYRSGTLGRTQDDVPLMTALHLFWRYQFENFTVEQLIQEATDRGNGKVPR